MGDAKSQTIYFMIGIRFHPTSFSRSYAQVAVILMVCARMICFRTTKTIMAV